MTPRVTASRLLRRRLSKPGLLRALAVHDAFSAVVAADAGIQLLFVGGFGAAASAAGWPDVGLFTLTEMADIARRVASRVPVPVIVDGDTGFGGVHNVARTVEEFERAGAAGVILEDQTSPKRCGHFEGKSVVPIREMLLRLAAARETRRDPDFLLVARTDARDVHGLADAIRRARLYRAAGADIIFIESPANEGELKEIGRSVKAPLMANLLTGGKTPWVNPAILQAWGFKIAVAPIETLMAAAAGVRRVAEAVRDGRSPARSADLASFAELQRLLKVEDFLEWPASRHRGPTPRVRTPRSRQRA